ncbi:MAG TPA: peptidase M28 [Microscillaceae bacterium]|nr:peptidase M28 [Microscillaceae bacterium]
MQTLLRAVVDYLCGLQPPRSYAHPDQLLQVADYIAQHWESWGYSAKRQLFQAEGQTYQNVIAHYQPEKYPKLIIGAHYDVYDELPGADDNASAVAVLMALSQQLQQQQPELPFGVELVAYCLEEPPFFGSSLMGSAVHARSLNPPTDYFLMICLEMLGYFTDAPHSQAYPLPAMRYLYGHKGNFLAIVGNLQSRTWTQRLAKIFRKNSPVPVRTLWGPENIPGLSLSDHRNYWQIKMPALMLTDTSFLRNPNYHTAYDTPETLDFAKMELITQGLYSTLTKLTL